VQHITEREQKAKREQEERQEAVERQQREDAEAREREEMRKSLLRRLLDGSGSSTTAATVAAPPKLQFVLDPPFDLSPQELYVAPLQSMAYCIGRQLM
jgi:hypothetical protein